jgi:hypothetical protein
MGALAGNAASCGADAEGLSADRFSVRFRFGGIRAGISARDGKRPSQCLCEYPVFRFRGWRTDFHCRMVALATKIVGKLCAVHRLARTGVTLVRPLALPHLIVASLPCESGAANAILRRSDPIVSGVRTP